jgi:hypothetical protein
MDREEIRVTLRLPADAHDALTEIAKRETRSLNSQIVHMLRESIERRRIEAGPAERVRKAASETVGGTTGKVVSGHVP